MDLLRLMLFHWIRMKVPTDIVIIQLDAIRPVAAGGIRGQFPPTSLFPPNFVPTKCIVTPPNLKTSLGA